MANKRSVIDLTGSSDVENSPQRKQQRVGTVNASAYPTPSSSYASSSQPRASQLFSSARDSWGGATQATQQDDLNEIIDLSQDVDEARGWLCIGSIDGKIVGIRYYDGYANVNEQVMVQREPGNPYDRNAIRINNVHGTQIGHLPKQLAAKLAPYMVRLD